MVRLREIPRAATFAWSPGSASPLLATGTRAGAVDADFSDETQLEIWDLGLDKGDQGTELQPAGKINADSRFHDIAWSQPNESQERGIIAGALESGSLDLWDAEKLRSGSGDSFLSRSSKHTGAIKAVQFNPFRHELLASSGAKGELYITDLNNVDNPFRLGTSAARADDYDTLDWNKKVPHILATASSGGFVTIWDVKAKKESLTLNNSGRKAVSAVAWNPDVPTKLATAVPNDQDPLILMWDLRNSNAPEKVLRGHEQGVLSLSWCQQDSELLLSCGKDNRTICWNPLSGEMLGEFPVVTNWTFQTRWNPHNPNLLATASFDGKIAVQSIQSTRAEADQSAAATSQPVDGDDFFAKAPSQPQGDSFTLPTAPKWLKRPVSVSFGFGGKLVKLAPSEGGPSKSKISISIFAVDSNVGEATEKFEKALEQGDVAEICQSKIKEAKTEEEKADWTVIETLMSPNPRKKLVEYLGYENDTEEESAGGADKGVNGSDEKDEDSFFGQTGGSDTFLSDLAASKGARTNNPFKIYAGDESEADRKITRALMFGSFEKALDICLKEDRMSDAFMIAICGGQKCIDKAQASYFRRKQGGPNYLRLLASVVGKNLWDIVHNADLESWKDVMATLCTFADAKEFPDLCEALGDRLEEASDDGSDSNEARKNATFCYLAGSKLEKVVGNWAQELNENEREGLEQAESDSSFSIHARHLQNFIEKVTIFRKVTNFQDTSSDDQSEWKLAPLYAKYTEYADVAAAHGQLGVAEKYLDLLPQRYPAAEVAKNRVKQATKKKAAPAPVQTQAAPAGIPRGQRVTPSYGAPQAPSAGPNAPVASQYAPLGVSTGAQLPANSPYAPPRPGAYAPSGMYGGGGYQAQSQHPGHNIPQPSGFGHPGGVPPPPRGTTSSPAMAPPSQATNMSSWNDVPDLGPKPVSRRGTPGVGQTTISTPFSHQPAHQGPPASVTSPYGQPQATTSPLAPPPKGPPRLTSPPSGGNYRGTPPERPSSAANTYAPPQPQLSAFAPPQPSVPRGASPYNPPPTGPPSSNRYAPTPSAQPTPSQYGPPGGGPPPPGQSGPPSNSYAPMQQGGGSYGPPSGAPPQQRSAYGPPPTGAPPQSGPPHAGPPGGLPRVGPPPSGSPLGGPPPGGRPQGGPPSAQAPAAAQISRHPTGDRTHISPQNRPTYEILHTDMQRVKSRAPPTFKAQVLDTEKRLSILFDHLNNEEIKPDVAAQVGELAQALKMRDHDNAHGMLMGIMTGNAGEGSQWMVGVKRLIAMSKATPE